MVVEEGSRKRGEDAEQLICLKHSDVIMFQRVKRSRFRSLRFRRIPNSAHD